MRLLLAILFLIPQITLAASAKGRVTQVVYSRVQVLNNGIIITNSTYQLDITADLITIIF